MRIAYFSPLPPLKTGIADYSRELLPELAKHADIDLFIDGDHPEPTHVDGFRSIRYRRGDAVLSTLSRYDARLYHMGNNAPFHAALYEVLCLHPGVVVLHDVVLHHFFWVYFATLRGNPSEYVDEVEYAEGREARGLAEAVVAGDQRLLRDANADFFPLNRRVLDAAQGLVVHSEFAASRARAARPGLPVATIRHYGKALEESDFSLARADAARARLGIRPGVLVLGCFGHFVATKRIDAVLRAVARLGRADVVLLLVGEVAMPLERLVDELGLRNAVRFVPWVDLAEMNEYLALTDVVVNLRDPYMGETSGAASRALSAGKPCLVTDVGWFSELPDACVLKVPREDPGEILLTDALERLVDDASLRHRLGAAGHRTMRELHDPARVGAQYARFLARIADGAAPLRAALLETAVSRMAALGADERDTFFAADVGAAVDRVFGGTDG